METQIFKNYPLILLAGGRSSRMGNLKGLNEYNGRPWLLVQLSMFEERGGSSAVVVLGHHHQDYLKALPELRTPREGRVVVINEKPEYGPFSSIQRGIRALPSPQGVQGAFILPLDVPCPDEKVWESLVGALKPSVKACVPEWEGRGGHPVLLSPTFMDELLQVPVDAADARLDVQIHALSQKEVARVAVDDPTICMNINTIEEWDDYAIA